MSSTRSQLRINIAVLICLISPIWAIAAPDDVEAVPKKAAVQNQFFMDDNNFEANVFQPHGNAIQAKTVLESRLKLQINEINRVCKLNEDQEEKLKLAGSADMKKIFDEADVLRKKYKKSKHDQEAWNNIWQEISPLQMKMQTGVFGDTSFFQKTLQKTLTDVQKADYDKVVMERRRFRYRAMIESVLTNVENSVPMRHSQHEALANLIFEGSQPPMAFGQYDQYVVMYYLSNFPEEKVKSLLDERQWTLMQVQFNQYRGMEQFLMQNGLIPKQNAEVKVLKARVKRQTAQADAPADANQPENQKQKQAAE